MLRKVRDDDGIRLSEKTFIFGNMLDKAGTPKRAADNQAALTNDAVNKYQIAMPERIIVGSAKAYLETHKLFSQDDQERGLTGADKIIVSWNMTDGIETLHKKMQEYYDNDRFKVLKARGKNFD